MVVQGWKMQRPSSLVIVGGLPWDLPSPLPGLHLQRVETIAQHFCHNFLKIDSKIRLTPEGSEFQSATGVGGFKGVPGMPVIGLEKALTNGGIKGCKRRPTHAIF